MTEPSQRTSVPATARCRSRWPDRPDRSVEVASGQNLLEALKAAGQPIASSCSGQIVCGRCTVEVLEGWEDLPPADPQERGILEQQNAGPRTRLACRTRLHSSGVVLTTSYW